MIARTNPSSFSESVYSLPTTSVLYLSSLSFFLVSITVMCTSSLDSDNCYCFVSSVAQCDLLPYLQWISFVVYKLLCVIPFVCYAPSSYCAFHVVFVFTLACTSLTHSRIIPHFVLKVTLVMADKEDVVTECKRQLYDISTYINFRRKKWKFWLQKSNRNCRKSLI